jgi:hypothetical protein
VITELLRSIANWIDAVNAPKFQTYDPQYDDVDDQTESTCDIEDNNKSNNI